MARKKIERLTPEQEAKFPTYVEEWKACGLSTEPADRPRAEAAIRWMYAQAGLSEPQIIWTQSPLGNALAAHLLKNRNSVGNSVRDSVMDSVMDSVWNSVRDSVLNSVGNSVGNSVLNSVGNSVGNSVWNSVGNSVRDSVRDSVWNSVGNSVWNSVRNSVWVSVYGQHDASWLAFYRFFADECGLKAETAALHGLWELCQSAGWALPYKSVCFVSERHDTCLLDASGAVHAEDGPAIRYPDGFAVYAWHGVRVPDHWIASRESLDPAEVLKADNVEQRAAGAAIVGWPKMVTKLQRKVIDGDPDSDLGALIELTLPGLPEPGRFLQAKCPRNGTIVEGVPRVSDIDGLPIETAVAAQAWRIGDPQSEYNHPPRRT